MADHLTDFNDLDEAATVRNHLGRISEPDSSLSVTRVSGSKIPPSVYFILIQHHVSRTWEGNFF